MTTVILNPHRFAASLDEDSVVYTDAVEAAGGTVSAAQKTAISDFVVAAKDSGNWADFFGVYLPIWGVAAANALSLKRSTDGVADSSILDMSFLGGGWTHAAGHVKGNGTSDYAELAIKGFSDASSAWTVSDASVAINVKASNPEDLGSYALWGYYATDALRQFYGHTYIYGTKYGSLQRHLSNYTDGLWLMNREAADGGGAWSSAWTHAQRVWENGVNVVPDDINPAAYGPYQWDSGKAVDFRTTSYYHAHNFIFNNWVYASAPYTSWGSAEINFMEIGKSLDAPDFNTATAALLAAV